MNKHDPLPPVIATEDLGLTIRLACAIGQNRQVEFGIGVPLNWPEEMLNEHMDKLVRVVERQAAKGDLLAIKGTLQTLQTQLETTRHQMANHEINARNAWVSSAKHGEFKLSGQALAQMQNFQNTEQTQIQAIKKLRDELVVIQERAGVKQDV